MKNLHLIPTDKPSKLHLGHLGLVLCGFNYGLNTINGQHIYITSDEEIKEGDWVIAIEGIWKNTITKITGTPITDVWRKIILTTDQDLIKDGVQAIDDEFLEWFVKNPSCEWVEAKLIEEIPSGFTFGMFGNDEPPTELVYKIIIPKEELTISDEAKQRAKNYMSLKGALEPKQETLEEANWKVLGTKKDTFYNGAKWQAERMYSEEGVLKILRQFNKDKPKLIFGVEEWFEQFKKK